jgi:hypothetical protein
MSDTNAEMVVTYHAADHQGKEVVIEVWSDGDISIGYSDRPDGVTIAAPHLHNLGRAIFASTNLDGGRSC